MQARATRSLAFLAVLATSALAPSFAGAQYLYLDSNGDGEHDAADVVAPSGTTSFDIWLVTDRNRDGSPATCAVQPEAPLTINSYEVILHAAGGSVAWGTYSNRLAPVSLVAFEDRDSTDFYAFYGDAVIFPPGTYHLGSMTLTPQFGTPQIEIALRSHLQATMSTSFGCRCPGLDADNTMKLGSDWFDADGLAYGGINQAPILTAPTGLVVREGSSASAPLSATDPDGAFLAFSLAGGPPWVTVTTVASTPGSATGRVIAAPGGSDAGSYFVTVRASDGARSDEKTFVLQVEGMTEVRPVGKIPFVVERSGRVRARLYDVRGRLRETLLDRDLPAGAQEITLDRRDNSGRRLEAGIYFYKIETPTRILKGRVAVFQGGEF